MLHMRTENKIQWDLEKKYKRGNPLKSRASLMRHCNFASFTTIKIEKGRTCKPTYIKP